LRGPLDREAHKDRIRRRLRRSGGPTVLAKATEKLDIAIVAGEAARNGSSRRCEADDLRGSHDWGRRSRALDEATIKPPAENSMVESLRIGSIFAYD
jgi:hypothetical protein